MNTPLIFTPLLKVRVWGGDALKSRAPGAPDEPVGESWEIADHGEDSVPVEGGPYEKMTLHQVFRNDTRGLCGEAIDPASPDVFPLMLKLIDPQQDLSVQVHPDDDYAGNQQSGELGKTEAWYVLEVDPGGKLYRGLKDGVTKDDFAKALEDGTVADLLNGFEVQPGDVLHMPAGTVHALGAGVRIAEIQQNSDTTYRVFDWNRVGLDGKPRELHVEHALNVTNFGDQGPSVCNADPVEQEGCTRERYIACDKFYFEKLHSFGHAPVTMTTEEKRFHILTVVNGQIELVTEGGDFTRGRWDSVLVPADAAEYTLSASNDAEVLLFYRP